MLVFCMQGTYAIVLIFTILELIFFEFLDF
jgi:hypothetical protein